MPIHIRHTLPNESTQSRASITFARRDYLFVHPGFVANPYVSGDGVEELPIEVGNFLVGPTILDMMVRIVPDDDRKPVLWKQRDLATLWPQPSAKPRPRREKGEVEKIRDHPFIAGLASGGAPVDGPEHPDFVLIEKRSMVSIAPHAYRLAAGMHGTVDAAYSAIGRAAAEAWDEDLLRSVKLWDRLQAAGGVLEEDAEIMALRPESSISQQIEQAIMREVCVWLGVDPDLDFSRPRGRPRAAPGDEGTVIKIEIAGQEVRGHLRRDFYRWKRGQQLADLTVVELAQLLGALRTDGHEQDADLLEAYLDAAAPDWRDQAAAGLSEPGQGDHAMNPYEVLGLTPSATMQEITAAYRKAMLAVHPDTANIGDYFARLVAEAYRTIRKERSAAE